MKGEKQLREVVAIAQQEQVVKLRNEKRGHGWMAANEKAYQSDAAHLEDVLSRIEAEMEPFLLNHRLIVPRHIDLCGGAYPVKGDLLAGSHILHPTFSVTLGNPSDSGLTETDEVFIADPFFSTFKCMSPFIRVAERASSRSAAHPCQSREAMRWL